MSIEHNIIKTLIHTGETLSIAESCSGGLVSHKLTNVSGSSQVIMAGLVTYSNAAKQKFLKVPKTLLDTKGAVSREVAKAMACGVRKVNTTDYGIGITGIAGPKGGTAKKPVGLVFIALSSKSQTLCKCCFFQGTRLQIKRQAALTALHLLDTLLS